MLHGRGGARRAQPAHIHIRVPTPCEGAKKGPMGPSGHRNDHTLHALRMNQPSPRSDRYCDLIRGSRRPWVTLPARGSRAPAPAGGTGRPLQGGAMRVGPSSGILARGSGTGRTWVQGQLHCRRVLSCRGARSCVRGAPIDLASALPHLRTTSPQLMERVPHRRLFHGLFAE